MNLYQRKGSPRWYVDVPHPVTGKRMRVSTGETEQRAARKAALLICADRKHDAPETTDDLQPISLEDCLDDYVAHLAGRPSQPGIRALALKITGRHPGMTGRFSLLGLRSIHTLTSRDLDELIKARTREGNAPQTIAHELHTLRTACRRAVGLGKRGPATLLAASATSLWRGPQVPLKTRYLSIEEYRLVYALLAPDKSIIPVKADGSLMRHYDVAGLRREQRQDIQDMFVMLAFCGGRWSEVARLTWGQVSLDAGVVKLWGSKTQRERLAPLTDDTRAMLKRRQEASLVLPGGPEPVFPGRNGALRGPSSCKPILQAMDRAGLNSKETVAKHGRATVHSLRHTFASLLLQNGAELAEVQQALGHSSMAMTLRYAHLAKRKSANRLGAILSGL